MIIHHAEQVSIGNGTYTDFCLPKSLGFFQSRKSAESAIEHHISEQTREAQDYRTTRSDYKVTEVEVRADV